MPTNRPTTFLLVHGSWHAGWCWDLLAERLRDAGQRVLAPDLPGHGGRPLTRPNAPTLEAVDDLVALADAEPRPVVLVGHSSGGMLVSEVARKRPERVAAAVYLAAFHLPVGKVPRDVMRPDDGSLLMDALRIDPCSGHTSIRPEAAGDLFYHDCPPDLAAWAISRLEPEASLRVAQGGRADLAEPDVPCVTILTLEDRALPIATQRRMAEAMPCAAVHELATGHSPFLSDPDGLAAILLEVGARFGAASSGD